MPRTRKPASPFRYFNSSPELIRVAVLMYVKYPLSLRNVEDLLHERGIDISYETVRHWCNRFGRLFAADIQRQRVSRMRAGIPKSRYRAILAKSGRSAFAPLVVTRCIIWITGKLPLFIPDR